MQINRAYDIAQLYYNSKDFQAAIPWYEKVIELDLILNDMPSIRNQKWNIALCYNALGINKKAINYTHLVETSKTDIVYLDSKIVTPYRTIIGKFKFLKFVTEGINLHFKENFNFWNTEKNYTLND